MGCGILGLGDGPVRLLKAVRGIDLVELQGLEQCCGFGGTFAVKNADVSGAMLADKTDGGFEYEALRLVRLATTAA